MVFTITHLLSVSRVLRLIIPRLLGHLVIREDFIAWWLPTDLRSL